MHELGHHYYYGVAAELLPAVKGPEPALRAMAPSRQSVCVLGASRVEDATNVSVLGLRGHDDEVEIKGNVVKWSAGGCAQKVYTLPPEAGDVIETAWCMFSAFTNGTYSLCVLQPEVITIFEADGPVHMVPLPFRSRRLWAACDGVIVEKTGDVVHNTMLQHGRSAPSLLPRSVSSHMDDAVEEGQPMLYSLLHPLEELRPLHFVSSPDSTYSPTDHGVEQRVLYCSTQVSAPLLVTEHEQSQTLFVWVMRQRSAAADGSTSAADQEVVLEEVWSEKLDGHPPSHVFVANDWCGDLLLCFVFRGDAQTTGTLRTLRLSTDTLNPTVSRTVSQHTLTGRASFSLSRWVQQACSSAKRAYSSVGKACVLRVWYAAGTLSRM